MAGLKKGLASGGKRRVECSRRRTKHLLDSLDPQGEEEAAESERERIVENFRVDNSLVL